MWIIENHVRWWSGVSWLDNSSGCHFSSVLHHNPCSSLYPFCHCVPQDSKTSEGERFKGYWCAPRYIRTAYCKFWYCINTLRAYSTQWLAILCLFLKLRLYYKQLRHSPLWEGVDLYTCLVLVCLTCTSGAVPWRLTCWKGFFFQCLRYIGFSHALSSGTSSTIASSGWLISVWLHVRVWTCMYVHVLIRLCGGVWRVYLMSRGMHCIHGCIKVQRPLTVSDCQFDVRCYRWHTGTESSV